MREINNDSLVLGVDDIAKLLGTTAWSVRSHIARKNRDALPPYFRLGRRIVWHREKAIRWLEDKSS